MSKKTLLNESITRREAIFRVSAMLGGAALVGQSAMLAGCAEEAAPVAPAAETDDAGDDLFSAADIAFLDEIAETILPETKTPGAKAAGVGPFMALMVRDCYYPEDQAIFRAGLETLDDESTAQNGKAFVDASPAERLTLLERLDREQQAHSASQAEDAPAHYFRMLKELALLGYFTSEIGYTQAMRYAETPGRYDPCASLEPGGRIWADHA